MDGNGQCEAGTKQGLWEPGGHPAWLGGHVNVWEARPGLDAGEEQGAQPSSISPATSFVYPPPASSLPPGTVWTTPFSRLPSAPMRFEQQYPRWVLEGGRARSEAVPLTPSRPVPRWAVALPPGCSRSCPSSFSALRVRLPASLRPQGTWWGPVWSPAHSSSTRRGIWVAPLPARMAHPL